MITTPTLPTTDHNTGIIRGCTETTVNLPGCVLFISTGLGSDYYRYTFDTGTEIAIRTPAYHQGRSVCTVNAKFVPAEDALHVLQQQFAEAAMK